MFFFILQLSFSVVLLKILSKKLTLDYTIFPFLTHHQWAHQPDYFFLLWNKHGEPWSSFIKSSIRNVILARSIIFYWSVRSNNCNNRGRSVEPTSTTTQQSLFPSNPIPMTLFQILVQNIEKFLPRCYNLISKQLIGLYPK